MAETDNDVDLTDKAELESFLKETGLDNIIGAMRKSTTVPEETEVIGENIDWIYDIIKTFQPLHLDLKSHFHQ